jgi:hypothetical protein
LAKAHPPVVKDIAKMAEITALQFMLVSIELGLTLFAARAPGSDEWGR